jgi:hypothetical protein
VKADVGYRFCHVWTVTAEPDCWRIPSLHAPVFEEQPRTQETPVGREIWMRDLAQPLLFKVEKASGRYTLIRTADVSRPVTEKDVMLMEAEELR